MNSKSLKELQPTSAEIPEDKGAISSFNDENFNFFHINEQQFGSITALKWSNSFVTSASMSIAKCWTSPSPSSKGWSLIWPRTYNQHSGQCNKKRAYLPWEVMKSLTVSNGWMNEYCCNQLYVHAINPSIMKLHKFLKKKRTQLRPHL